MIGKAFRQQSVLVKAGSTSVDKLQMIGPLCLIESENGIIIDRRLQNRRLQKYQKYFDLRSIFSPLSFEAACWWWEPLWLLLSWWH